MFLFTTEINFFHTLIVLHVVHRALTQHMALMQHGNFARDLTHKCHIVLNDDDAVLAFEAQQQFASLVRFLIGHAGGGFVHEQ